MRRRGFSWGLWLFLLLTLLLLFMLYFLPSEVLGVKLKRVDLLAPLRVEPHEEKEYLTAEEIFQADEDAQAVADEVSAVDSIALQEEEEAKRRRELEEEYLKRSASQDSLTGESKVLIQDYSAQRNALHHTFEAIDKGDPLRIAVLGDSFIEGDIFTYDVRRLLQDRLGGSGVGWMPITSKVANFRKGIHHAFDGWKTASVMTHERGKYFFGESYFTPKEEKATVSFQWKHEIGAISSAEIFYSAEKPIPFAYEVAGEEVDSVYLEPSPILSSHRIPLSGSRVSFSFYKATNATFYGIVLESMPATGGVAVDNFSLRGSSGITLAAIDPGIASAMNRLRHYQLIVLQYGLNVMDKDRLNYSAYAKKMVAVIATLQSLFPESDILLLGPPDRATNLGNGVMGTMSAMLALREAMRGVAIQSGVAYWDTYQAMQTGGGMVQFVATGRAAKDYTHLSFSGGRFLAKKFVESFFVEKEFYDKAKR